MELQTEAKRTKEDVRAWIFANDKINSLSPKPDMKAWLKAVVGTIPNTGDSVKEVREIRKQLSKEPFNLDEINKL